MQKSLSLAKRKTKKKYNKTQFKKKTKSKTLGLEN